MATIITKSSTPKVWVSQETFGLTNSEQSNIKEIEFQSITGIFVFEHSKEAAARKAETNEKKRAKMEVSKMVQIELDGEVRVDCGRIGSLSAGSVAHHLLAHGFEDIESKMYAKKIDGQRGPVGVLGFVTSERLKTQNSEKWNALKDCKGSKEEREELTLQMLAAWHEYASQKEQERSRLLDQEFDVTNPDL